MNNIFEIPMIAFKRKTSSSILELCSTYKLFLFLRIYNQYPFLMHAHYCERNDSLCFTNCSWRYLLLIVYNKRNNTMHVHIEFLFNVCKRYFFSSVNLFTSFIVNNTQFFYVMLWINKPFSNCSLLFIMIYNFSAQSIRSNRFMHSENFVPPQLMPLYKDKY